MVLVAAFLMIAFGALMTFRARGFLHWRRGYRNLSRFQRTWMVKAREVTTLRFYGATVLAAGFCLIGLSLMFGNAAPTQLAFAWAP
ncbi:MAG TPA: hypothetical protein VG943_00315 [Caulobacterales bacterium]|nr:hypothetical protein [Caulobacterales bacterium]